MKRVKIDEIERVLSSATVQRPLSDALGTTDVSINYYELSPGESFAYGYHAHETQEEVFIVHSGTVDFETESGFVSVTSGEAIRFAPGEHQQGRNTGSDVAVAVAIGTPQASGELRLQTECQTCNERTPSKLDRLNDESMITLCRQCGSVTGRFE